MLATGAFVYSRKQSWIDYSKIKNEENYLKRVKQCGNLRIKKKNHLKQEDVFSEEIEFENICMYIQNFVRILASEIKS